MLDTALQATVEAGAYAHRQVVRDRAPGQRQAAWVRIWPAMVLSWAEAAAA
jgi:hypothetical protein